MALARAHKVAIVIAAHETYAQIANLKAPFVYARWQTSTDDDPIGYRAIALGLVADAAKAWAKQKNPAAAMALIDML